MSRSDVDEPKGSYIVIGRSMLGAVLGISPLYLFGTVGKTTNGHHSLSSAELMVSSRLSEVIKQR